MNNKEILIFHDRLCGMGGSERIAYLLQQMFDCKIVVGQYNKNKTFPFPDDKVINLNSWNDNTKNSISILLNIFKTMYSFYKFKHNKKIIICSGMWSIFAKKKCKKVWYCHSPDRSVYDLKQFIIRNENKLLHFPLLLLNSFREYIDQLAVKTFDTIISNGTTVQMRVKRYYGKNSTIVEPISSDGFYNNKSKKYFLVVSRFESFKRVDKVIKAFSTMPNKNLIVVGSNTYTKGLDIVKFSKQFKNIEVKVAVTDQTLKKLISECECMICPAQFEDKGITPMEAWKSGKPVIVFDDGEGLCECITDWNGIILKEPYGRELVNTIKFWNFNNNGFNTEKIKVWANKRFSVERFEKEIKTIIEGLY